METTHAVPKRRGRHGSRSNRRIRHPNKLAEASRTWSRGPTPANDGDGALDTRFRRASKTSTRRDGQLDADLHPVTRRLRKMIKRQLRQSARNRGLGLRDSPFTEIRTRSTASLACIANHLLRGDIDPELSVRVCSSDTYVPIKRTVRLGVYPVTGNPLHWGHLLAALQAICELVLDQVVFVIQGRDERKGQASRSTETNRHNMGRKTLALFEPLIAYSDIGKGNSFIGEENIFRLLHDNPLTAIEAYYIVGSDHYRLTDAQGRPDTLPRLQQNMCDPRYRLDSAMHKIHVAFVQRGQLGRQIPTNLNVEFVPEVINSSSTEVRQGNLALTPYVVQRYLQSHRDYAKTIGLTLAG